MTRPDITERSPLLTTVSTPLLPSTSTPTTVSRRSRLLCLALFAVGCLSLAIAVTISVHMMNLRTEDFPTPEMDIKEKDLQMGEIISQKMEESPSQKIDLKFATIKSTEPVTVTVMTLMVWGSPGSFGTKDKEERVEAIGQLINNSPEVDVFLFTDLWMRPDHKTVQLSIPEGYDITTVEDLSLPSCDGLIAPEFCSGLAVVSKVPFSDVEFNSFDDHGDFFLDYEYFLRRGAGRVRIEVSGGSKTVDIFVTSLASNTYNYYYRQRQALQLSAWVSSSDTDLVVVGGDFNVDPRDGEDTYKTIGGAGLINSGEEFYKGDEAKWLSPCQSTLGNLNNTYTSKGEHPVIYDYVWHKGGTVANFEVPILKTKLKDNRTVSMSSHEAVISVLKIS